MKKIFTLKNVLKVFGVLVALIFIYVGANWKHVKVFPSIISSFYSKEYCSCLFVLKKDEKACTNIVKQWVPIQSKNVNYKKKQVTVTGLYRSNSAVFVSEKLGCKFVE